MSSDFSPPTRTRQKIALFKAKQSMALICTGSYEPVKSNLWESINLGETYDLTRSSLYGKVDIFRRV